MAASQNTKLYADEGFSRKVTLILREIGYDILTVQEAGQANQQIPDEAVLAYATRVNRAILTVNRADFIRLQKQSCDHSGFIVCSEDLNRQRMAERIHSAILNAETLEKQLIRVNRPATPG